MRTPGWRTGACRCIEEEERAGEDGGRERVCGGFFFSLSSTLDFPSLVFSLSLSLIVMTSYKGLAWALGALLAWHVALLGVACA